MGEWECAVCGYLHDGEQPPATCLECGAPKSQFVFFAYADDDEWDDALDDDDDLEEDWDALTSANGIQAADHV